MKFIDLPSGLIINLEQIAYIETEGLFRDQKPEDGTLKVYFGAIAGGQGGGALHCTLEKEDIMAFLKVMEHLGIKTAATKVAIEKRHQRD